MWNCISCEMWSAYKMKNKGLISKAIPVLKQDGKFIRNPMIVTDKYIEDGEIVYGEFVGVDEAKVAKEILKSTPTDFELLDKEINKIIWRFTNLFPGCLIKAIDGIRGKKKFFWDQTKLANRHWLADNMSVEAFLGFTAFNTKKITGQDVIDFVKYRQQIAEGRLMNEEAFEEVFGNAHK